MINAREIFPLLTEQLSQRGFVFTGTESGQIKFSGELTKIQNQSIGVDLLIHRELLDFPKIYLQQHAGMFGKILHINADGELCYIERKSSVYDIGDPIGQILACIERAREVLLQCYHHKLEHDFSAEFSAYWNKNGFLFYAIKEKNPHRIYLYSLENKSLLFADFSIPLDKKYKGLKLQKDISLSTRAFLLTTKQECQKPTQTSVWPPRSLIDLLLWLGTWDSKFRRKILRYLNHKNLPYLVFFIVRSPFGYWSFSVNRNQTTNNNSHIIDSRLTYQVQTYGIKRMDERYSIERNTPKAPSLSGKRIVLIGCGTIGGFLAELLVKAGAGYFGGTLILIDYDRLEAGNVGRHRLGMNSVGKNKATALENAIQREGTEAHIVSFPYRAEDVNFLPADIVIDATGEETLGHILCSQILFKTTMLSIWIEGAGIAVRGLLHSSKKGACYRCLWHYQKEGKLKATVQPIPKHYSGQGCEDLFVPFPASVSLHAACLAMEMISDWAHGKESPHFRTRIIDHQYKQALEDCDPDSHHNCKICH